MDNTETYWQMDYPLRWKLIPEELEYKIRSCIFSIIGASAGLPALVWSVGELIEHRRNGHRISAFIILLLLTDFTEVFLSPYLLIKELLDEFMCYVDWRCWMLWYSWWSPRVCGLLLNQLVALEGILSVRYPLYTAGVFSSHCFIIFYILVLLCFIISGFLVMTGIYYKAFSLSVFLVSAIMWIISCGASCSAERHSHTSRKADPHIVVVFVFNLLMLFFCVITLPSGYKVTLSHIPWLLVRLRLISDPLLCVLVFRQSLRVQTSPNPEETSVQPE